MVSTRTQRYKVSKQLAKAAAVKANAKTKERDQEKFYHRSYSGRLTRETARSNARHSVFLTAELLESILAYLPLQSLWLCQRVCKHFREVLRESSRLQTPMMLRASDAPRQCWQVQGMRPHYPNWDENQPPYFSRVDANEVDKPTPAWMWKPPKLTPVRLCPLMTVEENWCRDKSPLRLSNLAGERVRFDIPTLDLKNHQPWEDIFVTDLPCYQATVSLYFTVGEMQSWGRPEGTFRIRRTVERAEGIRIGDLIREPLRQPGFVEWSLHFMSHVKEYKRPASVLTKLEDILKAKAVLVCGQLGGGASLEGMVVPTEEEWRSVK